MIYYEKRDFERQICIYYPLKFIKKKKWYGYFIGREKFPQRIFHNDTFYSNLRIRYLFLHLEAYWDKTNFTIQIFVKNAYHHVKTIKENKLKRINYLFRPLFYFEATRSYRPHHPVMFLSFTTQPLRQKVVSVMFLRSRQYSLHYFLA